MTQYIPIIIACAILGQSNFASAATADSEILNQIVIRAKAAFITPDGREARYTGKNCTTVKAESSLWKSVLSGYQGLPVQDCSPKASYQCVEGKLVSVNARALVLLPTPEIMARIVVGACKENGLANAALKRCADLAFTHILKSNGGQFIVSGLITEPKNHGYGREENRTARCNKTAGEDVLFSFRDGSTVRLKGRESTSWRESAADGCEALPQPTEAELEAYLLTEPVSIKSYGRIADIHRSVYAACSGDSSVLGPKGDARWRALVKSNFINAWNGATDKLLATWVKARLTPKKQCAIEE